MATSSATKKTKGIPDASQSLMAFFDGVPELPVKPDKQVAETPPPAAVIETPKPKPVVVLSDPEPAPILRMVKTEPADPVEGEPYTLWVPMPKDLEVDVDYDSANIIMKLGPHELSLSDSEAWHLSLRLRALCLDLRHAEGFKPKNKILTQRQILP